MTADQIRQKISELEVQLAEAEAEEKRESERFSYESCFDEEELARQHQEDLERIKMLRLIDDDFMNVCFDGYIEGTELVLRIILDKPDIRVKSVKTQKVMKNLLGRDIWLDIDAEDESGQEYNIEIQRADKGADRKRARYHSSILDAHLLKPAEDFARLPETYVIFITENDVLGDSEPLYTIERQIVNTGKPFNDGEHIVYVNGADKNAATALGHLMHDFFCSNPDDMYYDALAKRTRYYKEDEKGAKTMCKILEDMKKETEERAEKRRSMDVAKMMLKDGKLTLEKIAQYSMLPIEQVKELAAAQ